MVGDMGLDSPLGAALSQEAGAAARCWRIVMARRFSLLGVHGQAPRVRGCGRIADTALQLLGGYCYSSRFPR